MWLELVVVPVASIASALLTRHLLRDSCDSKYQAAHSMMSAAEVMQQQTIEMLRAQRETRHADLTAMMLQNSSLLREQARWMKSIATTTRTTSTMSTNQNERLTQLEESFDRLTAAMEGLRVLESVSPRQVGDPSPTRPMVRRHSREDLSPPRPLSPSEVLGT